MDPGTIVFFSIFFGIIGFLVFLAVVGSKKDKREKLIVLEEVKSKENKAKDIHAKVYFILYSLVKHIDDSKITQKGGSNTASIGNINSIAVNVIKKINDSEELKVLYESGNLKNEFSQVLEPLTNTKPVNWRKQAFFSVAVVEAKSKLYRKQNKYKDTYKQWINHQWK